MNNSPVNHNDPTGHCVGAGGHEFPDGSPACPQGPIDPRAATNIPTRKASTPTPTQTARPTFVPLPTLTPTMNGTISSWLTAKPTGTLPTPQATRTPQTQIQPATSKTVTKFDVNRIDGISVGIDVASVVTGLATIGCPASGVSCVVAGVGEIVTIAGLVADVGMAQNNSDLSKTSIDTFLGLSDFGRAVPVAGIYFSAVDFLYQINQGFYTEEIWTSQ